MIDDILNGVLFVLIGLVIIVINFDSDYLIMGVLAIIILLITRFISVAIPFSLLKEEMMQQRWKSLALLTWGGLRGGISVALALSLDDGMIVKDALVFITYTVVVFSIIVQGLSIKSLVKWLEIK